MNPSPAQLDALARKYRALVELRAARDADAPTADAATVAALRGRLATLSREFPGCLRELNTLGQAELARRAEAAARAASGGTCEPWMPWIAAYHPLMRAALTIKRKLSGQGAGALSPEIVEAFAREASSMAGITLDATFVTTVSRPPQGRLGIIVLRILAARFDVAATHIATTLFPPRRPRPYDL